VSTHGLDIEAKCYTCDEAAHDCSCTPEERYVVPTYTFHQSWINTFANCPEQARLELMGELPRTASDATAMGSAMHAAAEAVLANNANEEQAVVAAQQAFLEATQEEGFRYVQVKTEATALKYAEQLTRSWYRDIYPQLGEPLRVEDKFDVPLVVSDDCVIRIAGAYDFADGSGIWDWKTANRPYEQWEVDRFKIQPTVYTAAYAIEIATQASAHDIPVLSLAPINFTYAVGLKGRGNNEPIQVLSTTRGPEEWGWLITQLHRIVDLVEADLDHWPMIDQGWHCSPRWCGAWDSCKGAHVTINVGKV
jgi:hypothetical protein